MKLLYGQSPTLETVPYKEFVNKIIMCDKRQLIQIGNKYLTDINQSVINFITTMDEYFNAYSKKIMKNIAQKSILNSGVNEKERLVFFNRLPTIVKASKQLISS